jgi:hypothetical protein
MASLPRCFAASLQPIAYPWHRLKSVDEPGRHASYKVAKKVLEWEFKEEIPHSRLRAAYGKGFKGAPLHCDRPSEGTFSRDETIRDAQAWSQEAQAAGGRRHV